MEKQITPKQYADSVGKTLQAITWRIRNNKPLSGVVKITKYGRFYLLTIK